MIPNDTRPGPPGKTMLICPVNGCPWRYERVEPKLEQIVSLATIGDSIRAAIDAAHRVEDDVVRAHLAEHPVEDFLCTIAELRTELAGK